MNKHLLHEVISRNAADSPDAIAVSSSRGTLTYHQLETAGTELAARLSTLPLAIGETAGIYMHASPEYITALLAVFRAGGVALPLDAQYPAQRLSRYAEAAKPSVIITVPELYESVAQITPGTIPVWVISPDQHNIKVHDAQGNEIPVPAEWAAPVLNGDNNNYLLFTSGSTGTPKGILGRHKSLSHFIHWEMNEFGLNNASHIPLLAPISFDVSLRDIFAPLCAGGTLYIPGEEKQQPHLFLQWMETNGISLLHCVPSFLRLLVAAAEENPALKNSLCRVQYILVAGEPLFGKDAHAFHSVFGNSTQLVNVYGPSETTLAKIFYRVPAKNFVADEIIPLGNALPNTAILVINDNQLCAAGVQGEIMIKTPFMTSGYVNNETAQQEKFIQNPLHKDFADIVFRTGDIGYYSADGLVCFSHRADDMVKINGNRVEPGEVQKTALLHAAIKQAVALVMEENGLPAYLCLYYTAQEDIPPQELGGHIGQYLPLYMHPSKYIRVEKIPLTPNGKTDTAALKAIQPKAMASNKTAAPADETTQVITNIWKAVLKTEEEPGDQSFFHAGGSSLKAIQMIARLYKQKGVLLTIKEIMAQPTVAGIHHLLEEKAKQPAKTETGTSVQLPELSTTQKNILQWAGNDQQWADFNVPYAYKISGAVDAGLLAKAIQQVGNSYSFFNRRLAKKENRWVEITVSPEPLEVQVINALQPMAIEAMISELALQPFSKENMLPARFYILHNGTDGYYLLAVSHLLMADGATMQLIFSEIIKACAALQQNKPYEKNKQLVLADEPRAAEAKHASNNGWWKEQFEQVSPNNWLPAINDFNSSHLTESACSFDAAQMNALKESAAAAGIALNTLLLAVFEKTISTMAQGNPCSYHNIISNRFSHENDITANLLYYVPVNIPAGKTGLWDSLSSVKNRLASIIDRLPVVLPADTTAPRPTIVLNMAELPLADGSPQDVVIEPYPQIIHRERFPVNISFVTGADGLHVTINHDAALDSFGASFVQAMQQLVGQILTTSTIS